MKKCKLLKLGLGLIALGLFILPQSVSAYESTKIKANFIKVNSQKYRRAGAESAQLGSIGKKKIRVGKPAIFERKEFWSFGKVQVTRDTVVTLTSQQVNTLAMDGKIPTQVGTAGFSVGSSSSINGSFVLAKYKLNDLDVISKINALPKNTRKRIKSYNSGRIITAIWVVLSGQEYQSGTYSGSLSLTNQDASGTVTLTHSSGSKIKFKPGTIVAYEFKKFKWKSGKKLKELKVDYVWR